MKHPVHLTVNGDPYEIANVAKRPAYRAVREKLRRELRRLAVEAGGL